MNKKTRTAIKRYIAVVLAVAMVFMLMPNDVYARNLRSGNRIFMDAQSSGDENGVDGEIGENGNDSSGQNAGGQNGAGQNDVGGDNAGQNGAGNNAAFLGAAGGDGTGGSGDAGNDAGGQNGAEQNDVGQNNAGGDNAGQNGAGNNAAFLGAAGGDGTGGSGDAGNDDGGQNGTEQNNAGGDNAGQNGAGNNAAFLGAAGGDGTGGSGDAGNDAGGDGTGGSGDAGSGEADPDDQIVENKVFISLSPELNDEDEAILTALTGESLLTSFYAFNDNPNATAMAKVRLYIDQTTAEDNRTDIKHDADKVTLKIYEGGESTTVTAKWVQEGEKDYLEFTIPAGASLSFDFSIDTISGYDTLIGAHIFAEYMVADTETGEYPDEWTILDDGMSTLDYSWTGDFKWDNFKKKNSADHISARFTGEGSNRTVAFEPNVMNYTFSADNLKANDNIGVVYTEYITLGDTLTLPEGFTVPEGYVFDADSMSIRTAGGAAIYSLKLDSSIADRASDLQMTVGSDRKTISFSIKIKNDDMSDPSADTSAITASKTKFNPLNKISTSLTLSSLDIDISALEADDVQLIFDNSASLVAEAVNKTIAAYEGAGVAAVPLVTLGELTIGKAFNGATSEKGDSYFRYYSENRIQTGAPKNINGQYEVKDGYTFRFSVTVGGDDSKVNYDVVVEDIMDPVWIFNDDVKIMIDGRSLVKGKDYTYTFIKNISDKKTYLTVRINEIPQGKVAAINYSCTADGNMMFLSEKKTDGAGDYYELNNTAKVGEKETTYKARSPYIGDFTIEKVPIARYSVSEVGSPAWFYYDYINKTYSFNGDSGYISELAGKKSTNLTQDDIKNLLLEFNAGDYVEYLIIVNNATDCYFTGVICDSSLLKDNGYDSFFKGWKMYFAYPDGMNSRCIYRDHSMNSVGTQWVSYNNMLSFVRSIENKNQGHPLYGMGTDLCERATQLVYNNGYLYDNQWNFNGSDYLNAFGTYRQSIVFQVPGDGKIASTNFKATSKVSDGYVSPPITSISNGNQGFQELAAAYSYYIKGGDAGLRTNAMASGGLVKQGVSGTSVSRTTPDIKHSVMGQEYINTGTLATCEVADKNNIAADEIYSDTSNNSLPSEAYKAANDSNNTFFKLDDNEIVVNYIYIYNDSDKAMDLSKYNILAVLPNGFEWAGFVYPTKNINGVIHYSKPATSVSEYNYSNVVSLYVTDYRNNSPIYAHGTNSSNNYENGISSNSSLSFRTNGTTTKGSFTAMNITSGSSIAPYTGVVLMYAAKVADAHQYLNYANTVTFGAFITRNDSSGAFARHISPNIRVRENINIAGRRLSEGIDNSGHVNSYLDYSDKDGKTNHTMYGSSASIYGDKSYYSPNDYFYSGTSQNYGGMSGTSPYELWSYVNLDVARDVVAVSVKKDATKNSGDDGSPAEASDGDSYDGTRPEAGWNSNYDDYKFDYILHDGIHRTVDGTVTWKTSITNEGTNASGSNNTYGVVDASVIVDTVDSPYELKEIYIPRMDYNTENRVGPHFVVEDAYIPIEDSDWKDTDNANIKVMKTIIDKGGSHPNAFVRITRYKIENGSLGWGYDVKCADGDKNTWAYQYVIEFAPMTVTSGSYTYVTRPYIYTKDVEGDNFPKELKYELTFSTTDSIETNYNSFSVYLPGVEQVAVPVDGNGTVRDSEDLHKENTGVNVNGYFTGSTGGYRIYANIKLSSRLIRGTDILYEPVDGVNDENVEYPLGGAYGVLQDGVKSVEYSDWTDTSYTDGEKVLTYTDETGETVRISTRENGNMVLPERVPEGGKVHFRLMHENLLDESENYPHYKGLRIYDVYSLEDKWLVNPETERNAYNTDFESIVVTDKNGNRLSYGTDYLIYYTNDKAVTVEHHPISPVNTLTYAADLDKLLDSRIRGTEDADFSGLIWDEYIPGTTSEEVTADAAGFMILIPESSPYYRIYNTKLVSGQDSFRDFKLYVDYDAEIKEGLDLSKKYPNIMAWSAAMYDTPTGKYKGFIEDTTAALIEIRKEVEADLNKKVIDESGNDMSELFADKEYYFLLINANSSSTYISSSGVYAAAIVKMTTDSTKSIYDNMDIVYVANPDVDINNRSFFYRAVNETAYIYAAEISESTAYSFTTASSSAKKTDGIGTVTTSGGTYTYSDMPTLVSKFDYTGTSVPQRIKDILAGYTTGTRLFTERVYYNKYNELKFEFNFSNIYKSTVKLQKVDSNGNIIDFDVEFELQDAAGDKVELIETAGTVKSYKFAPESAEGDRAESISFKGSTTIKGLLPGTYTLVEKSAPSGYVAGAEPVTFTVEDGSLQNLTVDITNDDDPSASYYGALYLNKVDMNGAIITTGEAEFEIYTSTEEGAEPLSFVKDEESDFDYTLSAAVDSEGKELYTALTTKDGKLTAGGLPTGTYYIVEKTAPPLYDRDDHPVEFKINRYKQRSFTYDFKNKLVSQKISINKTDENGELITAGTAEFELHDEEGTPITFTQSGSTYTYSATGTITKIATVRGKATVDKLPQGNYTLTEVNAPYGYILNPEGTEVVIEKNLTEVPEFNIVNTKDELVIRLSKIWHLEGATKTYPLYNVPFTLFKVKDETVETVGSGTTDADGMIEFSLGTSWNDDAAYYLYEEIPENYSLGYNTVPLYMNDETGIIDPSVTDDTEGYTKVECLRIDPADVTGGVYEDDTWYKDIQILNIKNMIYGGLYASVSYKTIDNKKMASAYGSDVLPEETGFSFYYTDEDYAEGNTNYVHALQPGDMVTYTLNVANVSDYEFSRFVVIDRLPIPEDKGVVNLSEKRSSEFKVVKPESFEITVDGKVIDPGRYTISYSDRASDAGFTEGDFKGTSAWTASSEDATCFRIVFEDGFVLNPGSKIVISFDSEIGDDAEIGMIAWNNFAYRYVCNSTGTLRAAATPGRSQNVAITPEPPKVGVMVKDYTVKFEKLWEDNDDEAGVRPEEITIKLQQMDQSGKWIDTPDVDPVQVTSDRSGKWLYEFTGLTGFERVEAEDGSFSMKKISYRVIETELPEGYTAEYEAEEVEDAVTKCTVTNTYETVTVKGEKTWEDEDDADGIRPDSITVKLQKKDAEGNWSDVSDKEAVTVKADSDGKWLYEFTLLQKYEVTDNGDGTFDTKEISYRVIEAEIPDGYEPEYTVNASDDETVSDIVNRHDVETTEDTETTEITEITEVTTETVTETITETVTTEQATAPDSTIITTEDEGDEVVKTGDEAPVNTMLIVMLVTAAAVVILGKKRKKDQ